MPISLRVWAANSITLQQNFKQDHNYRGKDMKVLGTEVFMVVKLVQFSKDCAVAGIYNKRQILKKIAEVQYPLGYFSLIVVNAKLFLRDLWKK